MSVGNFKLSIVVDNEAAEGFIAEHGFSVCIENGDEKIIFDCGQSEAFLHNLSHLGLTLKQITKLILSHGHYDHSGSIKDIVTDADSVLLYAHPDVLLQRFSLHDGKPSKDISIKDVQKSAIKELPQDRVFLIKEPMEITENIFTTGEIPRINRLEDTGGPFYLDDKKSRKDLILDDQSICIKTESGIVLITGCCHSGIINTLNYVHQLFDQRVYMIIGGLHLSAASDERVTETISMLKKCNVKRIIPCHCTGAKVIQRLQRELGSKVTPGFSGMSVML